jgi:hypothetical protein
MHAVKAAEHADIHFVKLYNEDIVCSELTPPCLIPHRPFQELARALASNCCGGPPKILLVDEPFAGVRSRHL